MLSSRARGELSSSVVGGCMHPMHAGVFECCHVLSWVVSGGRIVVRCGQLWSECGLGLSFSPREEVRSVKESSSRLAAVQNIRATEFAAPAANSVGGLDHMPVV